ncbi:hypothetical protein L1049_011245 [Liquidambar formosana]|uniref:Uncharacterized protein n=1 Tax=Liquidambar formosana TaxID=63359 RepID=A0AAP0RRV7_LIQFO
MAVRVKAKINAWKGSLLSIGGHIELVASAINSMLLYCFLVYTWPVSLLQ